METYPAFLMQFAHSAAVKRRRSCPMRRHGEASHVEKRFSQNQQRSRMNLVEFLVNAAISRFSKPDRFSWQGLAIATGAFALVPLTILHISWKQRQIVNLFVDLDRDLSSAYITRQMRVSREKWEA